MVRKISKRKPLTKEHKRKIGLANSIALKGKKLPEAVKKKISERLRGHKLTQEHKKHLSEALRGKPKSEEHRRRLSEVLKGKPQPWNAGEKCHFWKGGISKKIPIKCTDCGRVNLVRGSYLRRLNHPYRCRSCALKRREMDMTLEARRKRSLAHRKYNLDEDFFEKINNEEKAYWLGFFGGDGAITDENKIRLRLAIKDKKQLRKFKKAFKWTGKDYYCKRTDCLEIHFRSFKTAGDLERYRVTSCKTFTIKFPDIPKSLERHYIRGVFDADGCICRAAKSARGKSGQLYIYHGGEFDIQGNREFVLALQSRLVKELGLPINSINYSGKSINRVRYGGINQLRKIYKYLYENTNIFLERKKKLFEDILKNYHSEIIRSQQKEFKIRKL